MAPNAMTPKRSRARKRTNALPTAPNRARESGVRAFLRAYLLLGVSDDVDALDYFFAMVGFTAACLAVWEGATWLWTVVALILCVPVVRWVRRERDPWGWGALEEESGRSARRFV